MVRLDTDRSKTTTHKLVRMRTTTNGSTSVTFVEECREGKRLRTAVLAVRNQFATFLVAANPESGCGAFLVLHILVGFSRIHLFVDIQDKMAMEQSL